MDTNATTSMILIKLSNKDIYINILGNTINKFNVYFLQLNYTLASRGETFKYLPTGLFNDCGACTDKLFV